MRRTVLCGAALLVAAAYAGDPDPPWQSAGVHHGCAVEFRDVPESAVHDVRVTTHSTAAPATIAATLWQQAQYREFLPYLERLDVLRDDGDSKLIYERVHVPLLKDRDATLRVTRTSSPDTGVYETDSVAVTDEGPPPTDAAVRVRASHGHWRLAPAGGGSEVIYSIRADAGGMVPAWIVNSMQKDTAAQLVRDMLDRAERTPPVSAPPGDDGGGPR